jgi:alcohol dehydrogenase class IV
MVKAGSAILDGKTGERRALFDPKTRAQSIFIHPDFLRSAPPSLILGSGLNSFAMAIEGLTSLSGDTLADALLMHSVRLMQANLTLSALEGDEAARAELVLAAVLCGQGTDFTGLGLASAIGHAVGSHYHIDNGIVNVIVLPHTLRFNSAYIPLGLSKVATAFGLTQQKEEFLLNNVIKTIESLFARLKIPKRLRDVGVPQDALPTIATHVMSDWFLRGNPRPVSNISEIQQVLEEAW